MTNCDRCHAPTASTIMSKFNTQNLCMACDDDEQAAPGYRDACHAEELAVRAGQYDFPGIGLGGVDAAFLERRRAERSNR